MGAEVSHEDAKSYYEDFSLAVGLRDWLTPNPRHERLKLMVDELLGARSGLRVADVGCGAGVMTAHLCRFGDVVGVDFSSAAVSAARRLAPRARFEVGGLEALPPGQFDVLTLFDVLEHIPEPQRPEFVAGLARRLAPNGLLFMSTPFPDATRQRRSVDDPTLQIIDEAVELFDVVEEARRAGLQLVRYAAYDVFRGGPEYQAMTFTTRSEYGGPIVLAAPPPGRRERLARRLVPRRARRLLLAARALRHGDLRTAMWFARGSAPAVRS